MLLSDYRSLLLTFYHIKHRFHVGYVRAGRSYLKILVESMVALVCDHELTVRAEFGTRI